MFLNRNLAVLAKCVAMSGLSQQEYEKPDDRNENAECGDHCFRRNRHAGVRAGCDRTRRRFGVAACHELSVELSRPV
jgi:hypothetical protein